MSVKIRHAGMYRKVVYKSRGLCAVSQLSGAASIQVRLLLEGDLCAKSWVCKTRKSGLAHAKWQWNLTWRLFYNYFKCKQTFGMRKEVWFSPTSTTIGRFFQAAASIRVRLMCNLRPEKVRLLFWVQLLIKIKCAFYTWLYGIWVTSREKGPNAIIFKNKLLGYNCCSHYQEYRKSNRLQKSFLELKLWPFSCLKDIGYASITLTLEGCFSTLGRIVLGPLALLEYTAYLFTLTMLPTFSISDSSFFSIFDFLPWLYCLPFMIFWFLSFFLSKRHVPWCTRLRVWPQSKKTLFSRRGWHFYYSRGSLRSDCERVTKTHMVCTGNGR